MNHIQVLKRSWNILWSYKALWVFGILLALTGAEAFNGSNSGIRGNLSPDSGQWQPVRAEQLQDLPEGIREAVEDLDRELTGGVPMEIVNTVLAVVVVLVCLALAAVVIATIVRYVSRTALIRRVDGYEASGEKADWRAGFRLGWSRPAARLFLIDLLIFLAFFVGIIATMSIAAVPLLLSIALGGLAPIAGTVMTIGLGMLAVFAAIVAGALVAMARELFYRECALRGRGVIESIRCGVQSLRANFVNLFLLWLLLLAIRIVFFVAMIPVALILLAVGLVIGAGTGAVLYLALQTASVWTAIIVGAVVGLLLLIVVVGAPTAFLRGLRETYLSTAWTLGFRELPAPDSAGNAG
jgi:hypothetical protein